MSTVIAIVGAECTGKTVLTPALAERIAGDTGLRCASVAEYLREWCALHGRTPRIDEQAAIAAEQQRRIDAAAATHDIVVTDTTPLMTAVYSQFIFGDASLTPVAVAAHQRTHATLLTALDIPWQADGVQRDGPHVREPVDRLLRELMREHGIGWSVVSGEGAARVTSALDAVTPLLVRLAASGALGAGSASGIGLFTRLAQREAAQPVWQGVCEKCDVADCEHRLRTLHIGFAGSRFLYAPQRIDAALAAAFDDELVSALADRLRALPPPLAAAAQRPLCGVSQIAIGADALFARALRSIGARHRVLLPQPLDAFLAARDDSDSGEPDFTLDEQSAARSLLARDNVAPVEVVATSNDRTRRFEQTNHAILRESDAVVCLMREGALARSGGTHDLMQHARAAGKPVLLLEVSMRDGRPHLSPWLTPLS